MLTYLQAHPFVLVMGSIALVYALLLIGAEYVAQRCEPQDEKTLGAHERRSGR